MLLNGKLGETDRGGPRPLPAGISILVHAAAILLVANAGPVQLPKPKSAYQQAIAGREQKLVWYHFKEKLPAVQPMRSRKDKRPLRAEVKIAKQAIISSPKKAPKAQQMIWQRAPEINTDIRFDSANLVAVSLPKVEAPKQFELPDPPKKIYAPQPDTPEPPELRPLDTAPIALAEARKLPRAVRDFQPPASKARAKARQIKEAVPPELRAEAAKPIDIARAGELGKVERPWRKFRPPPAKPKPGPHAIRTVEPASLAATSAASATSGAGNPAVETRLDKVYRPFSAPPSRGRSANGHGKPGVSVPVLPSAPAVEASGQATGELNVAVVGLNPGNHLPNLPPVSRPAEFSAGPKINPKGGSGDGNSSAAIAVPDLTVRGGKIDTRSGLMARNATTKNPSAPTQAEALREAAKYITVDSIRHPAATRVSSAPDSRFDGRAVYTMAIQMPNITSFSGSWLMWYAERTARLSATGSITAPFPHRKVDPKYIRTAAEERVEGTVRLAAIIRKDGTVGAVELLHGIDSRLDSSAKEALAKWQFAPAMRNGDPIDVDVIVEIPFRLAPRVAR